MSSFAPQTTEAIGIQQCHLRIVAILNIIALLALFPTFYFVFESLIRHSRLYIRTYPTPPPHMRSSVLYDDRHLHPGGVPGNPHVSPTGGAGGDSVTEKSNNTLWILCWLELAHLVPLSASLLYLLFLYRYLNYYTHFWDTIKERESHRDRMETSFWFARRPSRCETTDILWWKLLYLSATWLDWISKFSEQILLRTTDKTVSSSQQKLIFSGSQELP